ncbi:DUF3006 domain-containing protein [bacterium]|nr:DUF3006 domain-containing protein [candidate division CSSED10-310 bacterium]
MKRFHFTVERIENDWAVLETIDGKTFEFPRGFLPDGAGEGARLIIDIQLDAEAEQQARNGMKNLRDSLRG